MANVLLILNCNPTEDISTIAVLDRQITNQNITNKFVTNKIITYICNQIIRYQSCENTIYLRKNSHRE